MWGFLKKIRQCRSFAGGRLYSFSALLLLLTNLGAANLNADGLQRLGDGAALLEQRTLEQRQARLTAAQEFPVEVYDDYFVIEGEGFAHFRAYTEERDEAYVAALNNFAAKLPPQVKLYSMLAPTSAAFKEGATYRRFFPDQQALIAGVQERLDERFVPINIYDTIAEHSGEYLYFRTDHHWTAQAGRLAYQEAAAVMRLKPAAPEDYPLLDAGVDYLGSIYNATGSSSLRHSADRIYYYRLPYNVKYTYWDNTGRPHSSQGLYKQWWLEQPNKYAFFMGGDLPLIKLESAGAGGSGRRLAIIKDSYANTIIPFLTANYDEIYVIDPRNSSFNALQIIEDNQIDEVLFINYVRVLCLPDFSAALLELAEREPVAIQPAQNK